MVTFHKKIPSWWFSRDQNGWLWQWVTHRFWDAKDWLQGRVSKMGVARDQDSKSFYGLYVPGSFYWSIFDIQAGWWFQTFFMFHNIWDNPSHWHIFQRGRYTTNQSSIERTPKLREFLLLQMEGCHTWNFICVPFDIVTWHHGTLKEDGCHGCHGWLVQRILISIAMFGGWRYPIQW